ncbi:MAG: aminotransferase class I/II-fold pyridoxal phosphate-dependent enzyme, partial [Bryobacterales bacterium]|nr:aminotransferase class I/II-fold pyridoxal phosphate-dependent enzyme [Bryobacterales bacterium]
MHDSKDPSSPKLHSSTEVISGSYDPALSLGSARPAVFRSSTYVFPTPEAAERAFAVATGRSRAAQGENVPLIYARLNHPNAEILEDHLVPLEAGARAAAVFNSGMAAIMTALCAFAKPGDRLVYTVPLYGGTQHLIPEFLEPFGITGVAVLAGDTAGLDRAIRETPNVSVVLIETPANPTIRMTSIAAAAEAARACATPPVVMVDNTFLGPVFQHPLQHGADVVLYSATKYLSGFSDLLAGAALAADPALISRIKARRIIFGNILPPDECWMLDGRLPTVALRMNRASKNAQRIAEHLAKNPKVARVYYPSLFDDAEQQRIFEAQCDFPGSLFSLELRGGKRAAFDFLRHLRIVSNAVSLGGVESLACHPKTTTHS